MNHAPVVVTALAFSLVLSSAVHAQTTTAPATGHPAVRHHPAKSHHGQEIKSKASNMAAGIAAADAALTPQELAIAERVYVGDMPCELGESVVLEKDAKSPGYFNMVAGKYKFHLAPVVTSTGAIRLEDARAGAVWLQLSNKSMLMSQKLGTRLADDCKNADQLAVAADMKIHPAPSPFDPAPVPSAPKTTSTVAPAQ